jgi:hypothetical protein
VAKKARDENGLGVPITAPSQFPAEPEAPAVGNGEKSFHWSSYARNEAGNEVEEIDYMTNFNKRFNKVIFTHQNTMLTILLYHPGLLSRHDMHYTQASRYLATYQPGDIC